MRLGDRILDLSQPRVMAIVNVTDDSFYRGSHNISEQQLLQRVSCAIMDGAEIIDIGGYSSRSAAQDVPLEQEWMRVERGLRAVRAVSESVAVSVDTFRAEVARRVLDSFGAVIINDISAGEADVQMIDVVP